MNSSPAQAQLVPVQRFEVFPTAAGSSKASLRFWQIRLSLLALIAVTLTTLWLRITDQGPAMPHETSGHGIADTSRLPFDQTSTGAAIRPGALLSYPEPLNASLQVMDDIAPNARSEAVESDATDRPAATQKRTAPRRAAETPAPTRNREWTSTFFDR